jgi:hypothetical protein
VTVGLAALIVLWCASNGPTGNGSISTASRPTPSALSVSYGDCGRVVGNSVYQTDCTDPSASVRVVSVLPASADPEAECPKIADSYTKDAGGVVCWKRSG